MVPYAQKIKDKLEGQGILNIIIVSKNKEIENLNKIRSKRRVKWHKQ